MQTIRWKSKDGVSRPLSEMTDSHLRNTIAMLQRKNDDEESSYWSAGSMLQGEMALDSWESSMDEVMESVDQRRWWIQHMEQELARRGKP